MTFLQLTASNPHELKQSTFHIKVKSKRIALPSHLEKFAEIILETFSKIRLESIVKIYLENFEEIQLENFVKIHLENFEEIQLEIFVKIYLENFEEIPLEIFDIYKTKQ